MNPAIFEMNAKMMSNAQMIQLRHNGICVAWSQRYNSPLTPYTALSFEKVGLQRYCTWYNQSTILYMVQSEYTNTMHYV